MQEKQLTLVTFQVYQDEFEFLGVVNKLNTTGKSDFGYFWNNFFKLGGYDNIEPYAVKPEAVNVWHTNEAGEQIYFQGKMVNNVDRVAEGYTLAKFPASDYLVLTHNWLPTFTEAQKCGIGFGRRFIETVQMPEGYVRNNDFPISEIEVDSADTPEGSRIEHWIPIKNIRG